MNFKVVDKSGVDPRFPDSTGTITWKWGDYTVIQELATRQGYTLLHGEEILGTLSPKEANVTSLRKWVEELIK